MAIKRRIELNTKQKNSNSSFTCTCLHMYVLLETCQYFKIAVHTDK